jgi:hypothetical protein
MKISRIPLSLLSLSLLGSGNLMAQSKASGDIKLAQSINQSSLQGQTSTQSQSVQVTLPKKTLGKRLLENTSLTYYQQFLGPTASGSTSETYNVFQEGIDSPGSGRAPLQSFHAFNLRHQINSDWAIGSTFSAVNGYTSEVENQDRSGGKFNNTPDAIYFNARAYVSLPSIKLSAGTLFTTLSYEHPTSNISKDDEMRFGLVAAQSFALKLPSIKFNAGLTGQIYRIYYKNNTKAPPFPVSLGGRPTPLQTMIVSGGPYVNYRFNDYWMLGSVVTFDWDQRGEQTSTMKFNNNLSNRARLNLTYFPQKIKFLQSVGLFTQALLDFSPETTAIGADMSVRF